MITLHGEEVKVGDKVWHWFKGWGEVIGLDEEGTNYPILVHWKDSDEWYSEEGKFHIKDKTPVLYWQPIEFENPKKPKQKRKGKAWQWLWKIGNKYYLTHDYYFSKEEVLAQLQTLQQEVGLVEPFLPSEIEREEKE